MPVASRLAVEGRAAGAALAFLTTVPLGRVLHLSGGDLGRAAPAFPLVGAAVGAAVGGTAAALAGPCPPLVAGSVAVALGALLTGLMHLDALADTSDALGARSRERSLEIMRDPRTGAYGAGAIAIALIIETAALAELGRRAQVGAVAACFGLARSAAPAVACVLPYARAGTGLARPLAAGDRLRAAAGVAVAGGLALLLAAQDAPALLLCTAVCAAGAVVVSRARFGGVTGDTLGAAIAITETACLVVATARYG